MKLNLDTLRAEIEDYLKKSGFVVFHGYVNNEGERVIDWDTERLPDYKQFLEVAKQLDVKLVVLFQRAFDATVIDRALGELETSEIDYDERRTLESRLKQMAKYDGFTCAIMLSFDYEDSMYVFEIHTDWFEELSDLLQELDMSLTEEDEGDEQDESFGGYYSRN